MYCQQYIQHAILYNERTFVSFTKKTSPTWVHPGPPPFYLHRQYIIGYVPAIQRAERLKQGKEGAVIAEGEGRLDPDKTTGEKK